MGCNLIQLDKMKFNGMKLIDLNGMKWDKMG